MHDKTMRAKEMTQFRDVRTDLWTEPLVFFTLSADAYLRLVSDVGNDTPH